MSQACALVFVAATTRAQLLASTPDTAQSCGVMVEFAATGAHFEARTPGNAVRWSGAQSQGHSPWHRLQIPPGFVVWWSGTRPRARSSWHQSDIHIPTLRHTLSKRRFANRLCLETHPLPGDTPLNWSCRYPLKERWGYSGSSSMRTDTGYEAHILPFGCTQTT